MKYLVEKTDRIATSIYLQFLESGIRVLSDSCFGKTEEKDKDGYQPCPHIKEDKEKICTDEVGKLLIDGKLPENVKRETAWWLPETWEVASYVEENALHTDSSTKERVLSPKRYLELRIQCLLKDWTLKESEPKLALKFNIIPGTAIESIISDVMYTIRQLDRVVVEAFYFKYLRSGKKVDLKNLKSAL